MKVINQTKNTLIETIDWVGIDSMDLPIKYLFENELNRTAAQIDVAVSLDKGEFKGIDMAELFFNTQELLADSELDFHALDNLTQKILNVHNDRSFAAKVEVSFDFFAKKKTLRSNQVGIQSYPIALEFSNSHGEKKAYLNFEILYASTCPCSEAASRKENLEQFEKFFANSKDPAKDFQAWYFDTNNHFAHPHAQKSVAKFSFELDAETKNPINFAYSLIAELEDLIQTSVHAAVRQEDEAAFTRKMGENLIFIEDAAKKFKNYIKNKQEIRASAVELIHNESIHPHNAKAFFTT
jgi:GTP cyclohydrolase IB